MLITIFIFENGFYDFNPATNPTEKPLPAGKLYFSTLET